MNVLVDTSVWSLALRRGPGSTGPVSAELRRLVAAHVVEIIGPIRQEVLSGIRQPAQFDRLERHLQAFPDIDVRTDDYVTAARYFNLCRSRGVQGSNTDFLICAVSIRCGLAVYTTDHDFARFAQHLPVALHQVPSQ